MQTACRYQYEQELEKAKAEHAAILEKIKLEQQSASDQAGVLQTEFEKKKKSLMEEFELKLAQEKENEKVHSDRDIEKPGNLDR